MDGLIEWIFETFIGVLLLWWVCHLSAKYSVNRAQRRAAEQLRRDREEHPEKFVPWDEDD